MTHLAGPTARLESYRPGYCTRWYGRCIPASPGCK